MYRCLSRTTALRRPIPDRAVLVCRPPNPISPIMAAHDCTSGVPMPVVPSGICLARDRTSRGEWRVLWQLIGERTLATSDIDLQVLIFGRRLSVGRPDLYDDQHLCACREISERRSRVGERVPLAPAHRAIWIRAGSRGRAYWGVSAISRASRPTPSLICAGSSQLQDSRMA